jgi:hypothetical protein
MKRSIIFLAVCCIVALVGGQVFAQAKGPVEEMAQGLIDSVKSGCDKEIKAYCNDVKPGEGRVLACLYAHEDKLSGKCEYALYDAAAQLERAVQALTYVANECGEDLKANCAGIKPGEGRILQCLDKNDAKVSKRCKQALKDIGVKK